MAPQESKAVLLRQGEHLPADLFFGPGAVDDHGVFAEQGGQALHVFHHRLRVGGQEQQVQAGEVLVLQGGVDGLGDFGKLRDGAVRVPAQDGDALVPAVGLG